MRKLMGTFLIISLLLGLGFAKNSANIPMQGDFEVSLEYGSQAQEFGMAKLSETANLDQLTVLGVNYGINDKWAAGISYVSPMVISSALADAWSTDTKYISKPAYLALNVKYQIVQNWLAYIDYGTEILTLSKKAGPPEDLNIETTKTTLGIAASKKCKLNDDITWGSKLGYNMITTKVDEDLETYYIDLPKTSLTLAIGGDYMINEMWTAYITAAHTFPSSAVGKYDDDIGAAIGFDQEDSLVLGIMATL